MTTQSNVEPGNAKKPESPISTENTVDDDVEIDPSCKQETTSQAEDTKDTDKLIGRGLKLPHVQNDGLW